MLSLLLNIIGSTLIGCASGGISTYIILNKVIPKSKEPKLDKDMEILLKNNGYVSLEDWRELND